MSYEREAIRWLRPMFAVLGGRLSWDDRTAILEAVNATLVDARSMDAENKHFQTPSPVVCGNSRGSP